ncbi:MAG: glycosyltransferase family 4 protein [Candidatus Goldbacteria bacterium]|nr:glycosyltransferase family 4 protein [Candidatus Goldiibacteriota bacterium]
MNKKIKLGLDVRTMSPKGSGIGRAEMEIVKRVINKLPTDKWEIHLFPGAETEADSFLKENVIIHDEIRKHNSTAKRAVWFSPFYAVKNKIDMFHSLDFLGPAWKKGFKLVQTIHDIIPLIFSREASYKSLFMCRHIIPFMLKSDDVIITSSENTKKDLIKYYKPKENKIKVVYLAGRDEFKKFIPDEQIQRVKQKYNITKKYFIFTGTLEPKKNVVRIAKAFLEIQKKYNDFCMVFVGSRGWLVDELYKLTESNDDFIFTGFVPDEDLIPLVKGAFCFLFPSIYEGFGMPVLDAFNAGVPLITSSVSSIPEIAGDAAILIDPYNVDELIDAMVSVIENDGIRKELVEKGRKQAEKFSWDKTAEEIISVYEDLMPYYKT